MSQSQDRDYSKAYRWVPVKRDEHSQALAPMYAKSGNAAEARKVLDELTGALNEGEGPYITLAGVYGCLGEKDKTFKLLEKLYKQRDPGIISINVSPLLDSVRADPRFGDLVRRIGLAP